MLSDSNTINDFNPYVMGDFSLPGASRQPQAFDRHPLPRQESDPFVHKESPICDYGITAGSKTIDMCRPSKPNCSLSRPLVPGRNIDRGFTTTFKQETKKVMEKVAEKACSLTFPKMLLIFLILLIALR
jgi:hypothetical protein